MRIPKSLQRVFLASQAGKNVEDIDAPEDGASSKTYKTAASVPPKKPTQPRSKRYGRKKSSGSFKTAHARPTALSLKILNRAKNVVVTAADATKARLRQKKEEQQQQQQQGGDAAAAAAAPPTEAPPAVADVAPTPEAPKKLPTASPQDFLDEALEKRGYSIKRFATLEGGYHCPPNPLQLASFGNYLNQAVRASDPSLLRRLLYVGISPNACNKFGESIVHSICRRGEARLLQTLLQGGCSLQVSDDYGRTPLHDACWQSDDPCFETVRIILFIDPNLMFLTDIRGSTPLSYIKKDNYGIWIDFLKAELDRIWPEDNYDKEGPPPLTLENPGSRPLPSQISNLSLDVISLLATGQISETNQRILAAVKNETMKAPPPESAAPPPTAATPTMEPIQEAELSAPATAAETASVAEASLPSIKETHDDTTSETYYSEDDSTFMTGSVLDDDDSSFYSDYEDDEDYDFDEGDISEIIMLAQQRQ